MGREPSRRSRPATPAARARRRQVVGQLRLNGEAPPVYADLCALLGEVVHRSGLADEDVIDLVVVPVSGRAEVEVLARVHPNPGARRPRRTERTPSRW